MRRARYTTLSRRDLIDAADFYEQRSTGLGPDFLAAVERTVTLLRESPEIGVIVAPALRRFTMRDFPYDIYFELASDCIRIIGVLHQSRDSHSWRSRVR